MKPWAFICRLGGVGDSLIASSVLPLLAKTHNVEVMTSSKQGSDVFGNNPYISKLTCKPEDDLLKDLFAWQLWFDNRSREYDRFYNLSHSCETTVVLTKHQTEFYWPASWRRKYCGISYLEFVHDICEVEHVFHPQFFPTEGEKQQAADTKAKIGPRFVGWAISGSRIDKLHPHSGLIIARIIKELNIPVVMFGGAGKDFLIARELLKEVTRHNGTYEGLHLAISDTDQTPEEDWTARPIEKKAPNWPLRRSLSQALTADLLISPDTGIAWACSMTDQPKIIMLSHASAENITKHWVNTVSMEADPVRVKCAPCHRLHDDYTWCTKNKDGNGAACITDISAEQVVEAARIILGPKSNRSCVPPIDPFAPVETNWFGCISKSQDAEAAE